MYSFIKLPSDLLSVLLTDWLTWKEVAQCDVAVCNSADRAEWLALLKNGCIFRSISLGYSSDNLQWLASRLVRIEKVDLGSSYIHGVSALESWLQLVGSAVHTLKVARDADFTLQCFERFCHRLTSFATYSYKGEVAWWDILRANPKLVELHLWGEDPVAELTTPTDLSLPFLRKLSIDCDTLTHEIAVVLLTQLPGLRSLQIVRTRCVNSKISVYDCLPDTCPRLVHLDLRHAFDINENNNDGFMNLVSSLKLGLHSLIVPSTLTLTERDLQAIVQYHGHSLCCLSIPNNVGCDLVDCLNSLTLLHTLEVSSQCLRYWKRGHIINQTIQHLLIDSCYMHSYDLLDCLRDHCPSLSTLSLCRFEVNGLEPFLRLLSTRKDIHTIRIDDSNMLAQLKAKEFNIKAMQYVSLDIFKFDY